VIWVWLLPALGAFFIYGIGQGFVKKWADDVPPAQFCFYLVLAKAVVNLGFFYFGGEHPPVLAPEGRHFASIGVLAYLLEGIGWFLYFESVVLGPITIVGTLSAAYPAFTVLFARLFLGEQIASLQYLGVTLLIMGCLGLSYSPPVPGEARGTKTWIWLASAALVLWGTAQTLVKYAYGLPSASEVSLSLFNTIGGAISLGGYALYKTKGRGLLNRFGKSFPPMAMMAAGDLLVILASKHGPISIVTPISGAYPLVTLAFAWVVLKERLSKLQCFSVALVMVGMVLGPGF
jgi:transporter family protein